MNAKFVVFVTFAAGLLSFLIPGSRLGASEPEASQLGYQSFDVAQVPAVSASEPKVIIKQPKQDIPRKAFKALDKHCARCHQQGRLERDKPAKNFGNVLKLDEIARDPHLILPGNPDGSRLFSRIVKQEMPYDVYTEFSGGNEPSKEDVQAIYDWIESLDANKVASCPNRKPVDTAQVVKAISANLNKQPAGRRKGMRYLTFTNFYNACASEKELRRMRNGARLLLNSLSRAPKTTRTSNIGKDGSIIAFSLDDLGWSLEDWDTLAAAYPYGVRPKSPAFDQIKARTKTSLPYLRADWFAAAASSPPLYYKLLDLPEDLADLQSELGVDAVQNVANGNVMRAGTGKSTVARHNRIAERHAVGSGYLWTTFDFDGTSTEQNARERPLGPGGKDGFEHDMNAAIFSLPNGMNAYFLADEQGKRINAAPVSILFDEATPRLPVIVGLSCISCHVKGVRNIADEVREHAESNSKLAAEKRDEILQTYVPQSELDQRIADDRKRYQKAAAKAGINLDKGKDGLDDLSYLASRYNRNLDLRIAAAEYGVTKKRYASGIVKGNKEARRTKQQLEQGTMTRRELEPLFLKHAALVSGDVPVGQVKAPGKRPAKPPLAKAGKPKKEKPAKPPSPTAKKEKPAKPPSTTAKKAKPAPEPKVAAKTPDNNDAADRGETITLIADKIRYRANDLPVFTVKASTDCLLTLINVGPSGRAFVIFPNKYQQENLIKEGKEFLFPGPDAPFQFRLKDVGKEKLIAECAVRQDGERIQHNFEEEEFTDLGDYRDHVGEQAEKEGEKKSAGATKTDLLRTAITFNVD
ncbi:MAG: DUF4384 domain-containing protein [Hyphomicrobiaceae bacterium]|nr:DUF4384 domain-containing protein [Hyphomicrobiaceae bacterium]